MLTSISWQQYLIAVITIASAYYAIVLFAYFRTEASSLFKANKFPGTSEVVPDNQDIMGKAKNEPSPLHHPAEDLEFSSQDEIINESNNNLSYEKQI